MFKRFFGKDIIESLKKLNARKGFFCKTKKIDESIEILEKHENNFGDAIFKQDKLTSACTKNTENNCRSIHHKRKKISKN